MKMPIASVEKLVPKEDRDLVFQFFLVFSRFEYALKRAGFINNSDGKATPNWDKFASKYNAVFNYSNTRELREAYDYFKAHPPRKQVVKDGSLGWSEPQAITNEPILTWLTFVVRIVRNNLFHGGKFPFVPIEEPARNPTLLRHALTIIIACVPLDAQIEEYFTTIEG